MSNSSRTEGPKARPSGVSRVFLPYLILTLGLCFTFIVSYYVSRLAHAQDRSRFQSAAQEIDDRIRLRVETSIALLRAGTGLFAASDTVDLTEFQRFVQQIELRKNYQGVQGIGFSRRFSAAEKASIITEMERQGVKNFRVWPDYTRDEYHSIVYLEPELNRNNLAIGFDMFTESVRRQAMERARDEGVPIASGRVTLVQEPDSPQQAGFLIYAPVYKNGANVSTVEERRNALVGFVYSPFRVNDFLTPAIADKTSDISLSIYDGTEIKTEALLLNSLPHETETPLFSKTDTQQVGGHIWTLVYGTRPAFATGSSRNFLPYTFAAGVLLSLLFFAVTRAEVSARGRAERSAAEVRESEATIRQSLAERELAEEALRESEERYRELFENANDIVYTLDFDGRITSINQAAETLTEYPRAELMEMKISEVLTPDSVAAGEAMLNSRSSGHERTNYEVDVLTKGGRRITLEVSNKLITKGGLPVGIQGIARDISTRRRAEEALREADQRALSEYERLLVRISSLAQTLGTARELSTIFRGLKEFTRTSVPCDGFFVSLYDPIRDVRTACYGWGDQNELDVSDLPPMPVTASGPNSRAVRTGEIIITNNYMEARRGQPLVVVGPDNGLRPESSMAVPMAVMGRIIGTIEVQSYQPGVYQHEHVTAMEMAANLTAVAIENTRLLKLERTARETAEESNRLKDEFLATVSHELRTPLTAILGWSRLLESGTLDEAVEKQAVETIWRNAKSQAQIIDDILDVSRIITGNLYLDLHPIELEPIVENAINVVRPTADAKGITFEVKLDRVPALVLGDANRLQQVIWNLLSNAIKFTKSGGRVCLQIYNTSHDVQIQVTDTGQGISREFLPFVFDRFRQADSTTTRQHGGLGLGLAIARHLVEIHGGTIEAESDGPGSGATFTIRLPLLDSSSKVTETKPVEVAGQALQLLSGVNVLLVDDDTDTLELMTTALTRRQATVTAVSSAGAAIKAIRERTPDVLISDIAMPEEDGYELIQQVRSLDFNIPAVAITAYAKDEDRERALSAGFQIYLAKPVELAELISVVAKAAGRES
jgi:PAS domain S-box-containing protein